MIVDGDTVKPDWIAIFDPAEPNFTINTIDDQYVGMHIVELTSTINREPNMISSTSISFEVHIKIDPCYAVVINVNTVDDMSFMIDLFAEPEI